RRGPGAGRPAKLYGVASTEVTVQLPPRDDALLARLLAAAVEADESGATRAALEREARAEGARAAEHRDERDPLTDVLAQRGYAPCTATDEIRMRNCPFHHLVDEPRELVCGLNLALLEELVGAVDAGSRAELDPTPNFCCVVLRRDPPPPSA